MKPEVILESHSVLGEGPWWDAGAQKLYWIDGLTENGRGDWLHRYDPATGENETWEIGRHIGCAVPARDGRVLMTLQDGIYLYDLEKDPIEKYNLVKNPDYSHIRKNLREMLIREMVNAGEKKPKILPALKASKK